MAEDVTALLAGWREAAEASTEPDDVALLILAADAMPRLVAAVKAVLKLADDWAQRTPDEPLDLPFLGVGLAMKQDCAAKVREAITAALTGEEASDE